MRKKLFDLNANYVLFTGRLEKDFPNYFNLKYSRQITTSSDIQNLIDNETAVISYFLGENIDRIYRFVITKKRMKIFHSILNEDYEKYIKGFNNALFFNHLEIFDTSADQLSDLLIPKIPGNIESLIIIPSGRLGTIPFEALKATTKKGASGETQYMVKSYAISYEFSAALLKQKGLSESSISLPKAFLCAPVKFPGHEQLPELPGTEREVSVIGDLFTAENKSVVVFDAANETIIKSGSLSSYDYIHFATHGIVDEMEPELSCIFLNADDQEDGNLYTGELFNLELDAEMVVLSACQTGLGKLSKGEGVIGLSRALTYAGAQNIVVSFWTVADQSTAELMTDFYAIKLKNPDLSFSEALRQSKLKMINGSKYSSPYFWAPFVLIGR
ncbi:MAG: CHAT domain-containing protein [Flammeovirgaceae bacterium]|nr:CHAT domain-containing protein [Flammeovirgaceae bacterium]